MGMMDTSDLVPVVSSVANLATNCTDNTSAPLSVSEAQQLMESFEQRSPVFAMQGLAALTCSAWKIASDPAPVIAFIPGVPLLVIGGEHDSLTPLEWAQEISATIPGSSLLVSGHYGHGATLFGSNCVYQYLRNYLNNLRLVPEDARCAAP
jgi:pimeloyl-ACP methyl ester carboxylesterase